MLSYFNTEMKASWTRNPMTTTLPDDIYSQQITDLHTAASKGQFRKVKALLNNGANIDEIDFARRTALHFAAAKGRNKIIKYLLKNGANQDMMDNRMRTARDVAFNYKQMSTVELFRQPEFFKVTI